MKKTFMIYAILVGLMILVSGCGGGSAPAEETPVLEDATYNVLMQGSDLNFKKIDFSQKSIMENKKSILLMRNQDNNNYLSKISLFDNDVNNQDIQSI